jgi:hypothetical protein
MLNELRAALSGKKTYIVAGLLIAVCAAEYLGFDVVKDIDQTNALKTAWEALIGVTIRAGIAAQA